MLGLLAVCLLMVSAPPAPDPVARARAKVGTMTVDQKIALTHGTGWGQDNDNYVGRVAGIPSLSIPSLNENDGPNGYHCGGLAGCPGGSTTAYPSALNVAATWSVDAASAWGTAMGKEFYAKGANVQLGPGLCLARVPTGGRNFEYISGEDPALGAHLAKSAVAGIQSEGVVATVKHYVLNNQEQNRNTVSVTVDERTFMELYFPPFQGAIDAGVGAVMCSYNLINGTHACGNNATLNKYLKEVGGFDGFVMSDWDATHTPDSIVHGLDQEMPGHSFNNNVTIKGLIKSGNLTEARLDDAATRVLTALYRVGAMDHPNTSGNLSSNVTTEYSAQVATQVAEESAVLLKNDGELLPLNPSTKVLFAGTSTPGIGGWGSGSVVPSVHRSIGDAVQARSDGHGRVPLITRCNYSDPKTLEAIKNADVILAMVETASGEGADRASISFDAPCPHNWCNTHQNELIWNLTKAGAGNKTIVVGSSTGTVLLPWKDAVAGIILNFMPGQYYGDALANVLYGDVPFSGKLPVTIPNIQNEYNWTESQYPGVQMPPCPPKNRGRNCAAPVVTYSEGLFVGYRWYDKHGIAPAFPFGHGLGYTTFAYSDMAVHVAAGSDAGGATVTAVVKNSGTVHAGREVAQVYLKFPGNDPFEPESILKAFNKTKVLKPGEAATLTFSLSARDLSLWKGGKWTKQAGEFGIMLGASSRDFRLNGTFTV